MKKIISVLFSLLLTCSMSTAVFAQSSAGEINLSAGTNEIEIRIGLDQKEAVYRLNVGEEIEIPIRASDGVHRSYVNVATLVISRGGRYGSDHINWRFVPKLTTLFACLGFTGVVSCYNYSGLAVGTRDFSIPMMEGAFYTKASARIMMSGSFHAIGYASASITVGTGLL